MALPNRLQVWRGRRRAHRREPRPEPGFCFSGTAIKYPRRRKHAGELQFFRARLTRFKRLVFRHPHGGGWGESIPDRLQLRIHRRADGQRERHFLSLQYLSGTGAALSLTLFQVTVTRAIERRKLKHLIARVTVTFALLFISSPFLCSIH